MEKLQIPSSNHQKVTLWIFSGSNIELNNVFISNIKNKGLSAGENSKVNGSSIFFNNVGVGIACQRW
jgi:hypothetical protein